MSRKRGLGRGLDALISSSEQIPRSGSHLLPVDVISPNPRQPRRDFDSEELSGLAESIRKHGILQPLIVTQDEIGEGYTLIAGERRLQAARQAGLKTVPVIIRSVSEQQRLELALIENIQRTDLNPLEAAEAYRQLADEFNLSHDEIAARVGKSRTAVTNTLRLLKLSPTVRAALKERKISEGHARALLALASPQAQSAALDTILRRGLSVRQTEALIQQLRGEKPTHTPKPPPSPEVVAIEERLRAHLGTKVSLNKRKNGGTLVIHFYSDEELNSLLDTFLLDEE